MADVGVEFGVYLDCQCRDCAHPFPDWEERLRDTQEVAESPGDGDCSLRTDYLVEMPCPACGSRRVVVDMGVKIPGLDPDLS